VTTPPYDFQAVYDSPWHHPFLSWMGTAVLLGGIALARRVPFLTAFVLMGAAEIALDAWFTGAWAPLPQGHPALQPLAIGFVVLGDWRFFVLVERYARPPGETPPLWRVLAVSLVWALGVPVVQGVMTRVLPELFSDLRHTFLAYELGFLALALGLRFGLVGRRLEGCSPGIRRYVLALAEFEALQYALWAGADLLILSGQSWALALRIVPNVLYYAGFLAFAYLMAPREELR
jgi:hypothetical protein